MKISLYSSHSNKLILSCPAFSAFKLSRPHQAGVTRPLVECNLESNQYTVNKQYAFPEYILINQRPSNGSGSRPCILSPIKVTQIPELQTTVPLWFKLVGCNNKGDSKIESLGKAFAHKYTAITANLKRIIRDEIIFAKHPRFKRIPDFPEGVRVHACTADSSKPGNYYAFGIDAQCNYRHQLTIPVSATVALTVHPNTGFRRVKQFFGWAPNDVERINYIQQDALKAAAEQGIIKNGRSHYLNFQDVQAIASGNIYFDAEGNATLGSDYLSEVPAETEAARHLGAFSTALVRGAIGVLNKKLRRIWVKKSDLFPE